MNILHIDASASDAETSHSRRLSADLVARLTVANPGARVTYRDVAADRLPHVDTTIVQAWMPEVEKDDALMATATRSKELVEELKAADIVVIGSPMYNFTVPSTLKSWIDHVAIAGQTFRYTENGPEGLLTGKGYLALASGGIYSKGPAAGADHLSTYLTTVLGFMGITDVEIVRAEGIAYGPEQDAAAMKDATAQIASLVAS
ncbi:FMN-dependent NADH-azoreductase [Paracoccus sp. JM45]|uniref:FMN-dependent NADH-azoreductase n=1 Tax=Paracoccus sp. JM45 TaxID=2283626 RepID=UPI000E6C9FDC|nr:FMN-dependent NADH-azoreductase [Paracoccus sp. JM45]RJE78752.1 FMN-dependent NADH-azoreductase [Paracoccus sp. JM45]